jgi:hypothetical protein
MDQMSNVSTEAKAITKGLTDGVQAHDLKPVLDELNKDKASMSAKDYASLFQNVNKEIKTSLPGLTLSDDSATGAVSLSAADKYDMKLNLTGDAAGASNLQQVAADAQMPNPDAIAASRMQGATLTSTDSQGDKNYTLPDGSQITTFSNSDGTTYMGSGNLASDNFTIKSNDQSASASFDDNTGVQFDRAANSDTMYDKNLNVSGTITRNADGTVTDKKVSLKADLTAIAQGVGVVAIAAAANYDDYKIDSNPNLDPIGKIIETNYVNNSAADLITQIVPPPQD